MVMAVIVVVDVDGDIAVAVAVVVAAAVVQVPNAVVLLRFREEPTLAALVWPSPPLLSVVDCLYGCVGVVPVCFSVN